MESSPAPSAKPTAAPLSASPSQASTVLASSSSSPTIVFSPSTPEPSELPAKSRPMSPPTKLGVRFAEDEKEDGVPLGYVLRIKQKREQKNRFLEAEKQRRAHEEDRRKFEEERRRQEAERKRWEQERAAWEKEKRAMEEERKKKLYAEELAAARSRRESTRFGNMPRSDSDPTMTWDGSERERELRVNRGRATQDKYTRPLYDTNAPTPRRLGSEPTIPSSRTRKESSPSSSRPSSVVAPGSNNGSVRGSSRPPSMYSTPQSSAPDVSIRDRRESKGSRRGSMVSIADSQSTFQSGFPWNMNMSPMVPPVPPLPNMSPMPMVPMVPYMMEMPLLPPSPPFMMQQYGRPHQQRSHSSSPTTGTNRLPASQSTDRVNRQGVSPGRHERRASGDISEIQRSRASTPRSASYDRSSKATSPNTPRTPASRTQSGSGSPSGTVNKPRSTSRHSAIPSSYVPPQSSSHSSQKPIQPIPVMTTSWTQPAFQNLSRPQANRRQTMIS